MAKSAVNKIAEHKAREKISIDYFNAIKQQTQQEVNGQLYVAKNLHEINLRAEQIEAGADRFVSNEAAYAKLEQAKKQEALGRQFVDPKSDSKLVLNKQKSDDYFREIVETGGAPSVEEISRLAQELKAAQTVSSFYKIKKYWASIQEEQSFSEKDEREATHSDLLRNTITLLNKGHVEQAYAELQKVHFTTMDMTLVNKTRTEEKINRLKFLIECHVFAGRFNDKLVEDLKADYHYATQIKS